MVATNWQTYDLGQQLNEAMFEGIKRLGYLLKPPSLRKPLLKTSKKMVLRQTNITIPFSITIISAHHLPKAKDSTCAINPFVSFEIVGARTVKWDEPSMERGRTCVVTENGFNPIWNETFSGTIEAPSEVLFVRFCLNSSSSYIDATDFAQIGFVTSKLTCLKQGYRYIPILDLLGEELVYSTLFVRITMELPVT
jgi:phosphatidylinositol phospholipase C delta